jgi:hypothetical protein
MGYARLHFNNNLNGGGTPPSTGKVIRDIAGVIAGDYTTVGQLQAATSGLSEIINSAGRGNWTKVYPNTLTDSIPYVLSSACVNGQTKFIQIGDQGSGTTFGQAARSAPSNPFGYAQGVSTNGISMRSVTAATSAILVSNPSFLNNITQTSVSTFNFIAGPYVWLSWSSRHCLIIGSNIGTGTTSICATGCFEFNETSIYDYRNVAPFCHAQWFNTTIASTSQPPTDNASATQSSFMIQNYFRPDTSTAIGSYNLRDNVTNVNYFPVMNTTAGFYPSTFTKNSSGAAVSYLQPLYWHQHQIGLPHHYISDLSKVYRTQPVIGNPGDLMTVDGSTYAYFDLNHTSTNNFALALLRA